MRSYKDLNIEYQGTHLIIQHKELSSLAGSPNHITGDYDCRYNSLTSLLGGPQRVDGYYDCSENNLTSLVGCASHIGSILYCYDATLQSLVGIHKLIKSCPIIFFKDYQILQGGIGLLLIDDVIDIASTIKPFKIIKSYLGTGNKGMMACRNELIEKGYADYAKL